MNATPELRFLLQLTRTALGRPEPVLDPVGVAWPQFVAEVDRHRLAPFLHARAAPAIAAHCPSAVANHIQASAARSHRRSLAQIVELCRLSDALATAGISSFTVKGVALAQQLHGAPSARFASDVDLVVAPEEVGRADAVLQSAGLRRTRPAHPLTARQARAFLAVKPEFEYLSASVGAPLRVELLWRLEGLHIPGPLVSVPLAQRTVRTLALEDHVLFLFQHGARHAWFRLFWLVDIALLLDRPELDWAALRTRARVAGSERALLQGSALAAELFGARLPAPLAAAPTDAALVAEARRQIVRPPESNESVWEWARQLRYRVRLARGAAAKWRVLAPHVFSPAGWETWPLPDRWFWLYYPATPFLWLWRYLRR